MLLHGDAQLLDALDVGVDTTPGQDVGDGGAGVGGGVHPRVLGQVAEPALADHPPGGRLGMTTEHTEQAGLARPVATDEADLVLGHDREVGPLDNEAAADRHGETLRLQHGSSLAGTRCRFQPRFVAGSGPAFLGGLRVEVRCDRPCSQVECWPPRLARSVSFRSRPTWSRHRRRRRHGVGVGVGGRGRGRRIGVGIRRWRADGWRRLRRRGVDRWRRCGGLRLDRRRWGGLGGGRGGGSAASAAALVVHGGRRPARRLGSSRRSRR